MKDFWISAYTQQGYQFGAEITADSVKDMFVKFRDEYPDCEIADYDEYEE